MIRFGRDTALESALALAHATIADLRRRLDDADADRRMLLTRLTEMAERIATQPRQDAPPPMVDLSGVVLPAPITDEIMLVATNGAMARHLEQWAMSELRRGTEISVICERIREGDEVLVRREDDDE